MILLNDDIYKETSELKLGIKDKSTLLRELAEWFAQTYSVTVLNFQLDELKTPNIKRYQLVIIVDRESDFDALQSLSVQEMHKIRIAQKFRQLVKKHDYLDERGFYGVSVVYSDFSDAARTAANWNAFAEIKDDILERFPSVWDLEAMFTSSVVFYHSDAELEQNERQGVSAQIFEDYFAALKKNDAFDYYSRKNFNLRFDSKENLDRSYKGSVFNYLP